MTVRAAEVATRPSPRLGESVRAALLLGAREVRLAIRQPAYLFPNLFIPIFFFFVMVGSISELAEGSGRVRDYGSFQLPLAVLFATTGGSAGLNMVTDIETGYFEKLLLSPTSRMSLLIGAMGADFVRVTAQGALVVMVATLTGTNFATGIPGAVVFVLLAGLWGLAYSAIGFFVALKTGSSQATQSAWVVFFPLIFLSTAFAPLEALSGWLETAARFNPMTYLLDGLRSLSMSGWDAGALGWALLTVAGVGVVTLTLAFRALIGRVR